MSITNKDSLRDYIHSIHDFLRNNGAGYGMNALKIFNIFYGLLHHLIFKTPIFLRIFIYFIFNSSVFFNFKFFSSFITSFKYIFIYT